MLKALSLVLLLAQQHAALTLPDSRAADVSGASYAYVDFSYVAHVGSIGSKKAFTIPNVAYVAIDKHLVWYVTKGRQSVCAAQFTAESPHHCVTPVRIHRIESISYVGGKLWLLSSDAANPLAYDLGYVSPKTKLAYTRVRRFTAYMPPFFCSGQALAYVVGKPSPTDRGVRLYGLTAPITIPEPINSCAIAGDHIAAAGTVLYLDGRRVSAIKGLGLIYPLSNKGWLYFRDGYTVFDRSASKVLDRFDSPFAILSNGADVFQVQVPYRLENRHSTSR